MIINLSTSVVNTELFIYSVLHVEVCYPTHVCKHWLTFGTYSFYHVQVVLLTDKSLNSKYPLTIISQYTFCIQFQKNKKIIYKYINQMNISFSRNYICIFVDGFRKK